MKRIKNTRIAVLGYGSQGRALALNFRDSGLDIIVGLRPKSKSLAKARRDKIRTTGVKDAARQADIIIIALPDHRHGEVLDHKFFESLDNHPALVFLHGTSIYFGLVEPPPDFPVWLLAPHAPGLAVRENYIEKKSFSAFYAVRQGSPKAGFDTIKNLAAAAGIPDSHLMKTNFGDEAVGDLFGEQAVLCGGLARLLKFGFEALVETGLSPANAYLEVAYQLDLIIGLVKKHGLSGMFDRISPLARYGSAMNGPTVIPRDVKHRMATVLNDIDSGRFIQLAQKSKMKPEKSDMDRLTNKSFDRQAKKFAGKDK